MKKVIILSVTCNQDFFLLESDIVRKTYAKPILKGEYENIDFYDCTSTEREERIENHRIYVHAPDDINGTMEKF